MQASASGATRARSASRSRFSPRQRANLLWGLFFCSPAIVGLLGFTIYPIIASFYYSLNDYNALQPPSYVGLENYRQLLTADPLFYKVLGNTAFFVLGSVPLGIATAFGLALLLNLKVRGQTFYRTLFYVPTIVPFVASSVLWTWIFNTQYGIANALLAMIGIRGPGWLTDPVWSKPSLIIMSIWSVGGVMVIFLAGLQGVPQEQYEAAQLDGATAWQRLRYITIPFMSPYLLFSLVMGLIGSFQYFAQVFIMTNGGPANSTNVYAMYLFQNAFQFFKMGYASAMAWIVFVIIVICTALVFRGSAGRVYYGGH